MCSNPCSSVPIVESNILDPKLVELFNKIKSSESKDISELLDYVEDSVIGKDEIIKTPFGRKLNSECWKVLTYVDYTASGRSLSFIEDIIRSQVLPLYGNTHSLNSMTGFQSTMFRNEARKIIAEATNCSDDDVVLFRGDGCTGAIGLLSSILDIPSRVGTEKGVMFLGPFEHHSNLLIWRENPSLKVIQIGIDESGTVDLLQLENLLIEHQNAPLIMGTFAAVSNVTGIVSDVDYIAELLHRYNALAFFDYAAGAPYLEMDMENKDAVFFSMHKLVGGPDTPGILIAKKHLFVRDKPVLPGGGTVFFVSPWDVEYLHFIEEREEAGTPNIIADIRAGIVMQLKQKITAKAIENRDLLLATYVYTRLNSHPYIQILGPSAIQVKRMPIFSFLIIYPPFSAQENSGKYLNHQFVCVLLNDLFGLQTRSGCACAGPYGHTLFGVGKELSEHFMNEIKNGHEFIKPGFIRFNIPFFMLPNQIEFVMQAIEWVATHGWKLLPLFKCEVSTGIWHHRSDNFSGKNLKKLCNLIFKKDSMQMNLPSIDSKLELDRFSYVDFANDILKEALLLYKDPVFIEETLAERKLQVYPEFVDSLRWFPLPVEALIGLNSALKYQSSESDKNTLPLNYFGTQLDKYQVSRNISKNVSVINGKITFPNKVGLERKPSRSKHNIAISFN